MPEKVNNADNLLAAMGNNTFSLQQTHESAVKAMQNSYVYLSKLQRAIVDYHTPTEYSSFDSLSIDDKYDVVIHVPYNIIHPDDRRKYRISEFYDKDITMDDIINNPDIFRYFPVVIIDEQVVCIKKYRFTLNETFDVVLDIDKSYRLDEHRVKVFIFDNYYISDDRVTRKTFVNNGYKFNSRNILRKCPSDFNGTIFLYFHNGFTVFGSNLYAVDPSYKTTGMIDISAGITEETLHQVLEDSTLFYVYAIFVPDLYKSEVFDYKNPYLVLPDDYSMPVPKENIVVVSYKPETGSMMEVIKPTEHIYPNIYKFDCEPDKSYQAYYFYKDDEDKILKFNNKFKFFFDYLEYKYSRSTTQMLFNNIMNGSIELSDNMSNYLDKVINYVDPSYDYTNKNFDESNLLSFDYKTGKLREFIDYDPWILKDYIIDQNKVGYRRYLYVKDIDLASRYRLNTFAESTCEKDNLVFDEPRYVFMFKNDYPNILHIRFYVDGIICPIPHSVLAHGIEYYYVPASMFKDDSVVEIERLDQYRFREKLNCQLDVEGNYSQIIQFPQFNNANPTVFDIYFTDAYDRRLTYSAFKVESLTDGAKYSININEQSIDFSDKNMLEKISFFDSNDNQYFVKNGKLVDSEGNVYKGSYDVRGTTEIEHIKIQNVILTNTNDQGIEGDITLYDTSGAETSFNDIKFKVDDIGEVLGYNNSFLFLKSGVKVTLVGTMYKDKDVWINVNKHSRGFNFFVECPSVPNLVIPEVNILHRRRKEYMRVFLNGKLLHPDSWIFKYVKKKGYIRIALKKACKKGDVVSVDMNVNAYRIEYHLTEIPEDYIIDVNHFLDKPLALEYYDIYVNGRKLNESNVTILTPTKMILSGVHSRKDLQIISKDRDPEYYGFDENGCTTELDEFIDSVLPEDDKGEFYQHLVNEINPNADGDNIISDDSEEYLLEDVVYNERDYNRWAFYFNELSPIGHLNPDLVQFNYLRLKQYYPYINEDYKRGTSKRTRKAVTTDPDIVYNAGVRLLVGGMVDVNDLV
jgi:hypothetical protein